MTIEDKTKMKVRILNESGYDQALLGMSLSFMEEGKNIDKWFTSEKSYSMKKLALTQSHKDGGHNKFIESMQMWIAVKAPRGWWQEADTYRIGMTKNSASTMHTIQRRPLTLNDFEYYTDIRMITIFNEILNQVTDNFTNKQRLQGESLQHVKWNLPEGFLQTRIMNCNYKTLRNMILQRKSHYLLQWQYFINEIKKQCSYPELLPFD